MKKFGAFIFLSATCFSAFSQALFNNNGADIYVKDGGFMIVKTNSINNTPSGGLGRIDNAGTIVVEGNVTNSSAITGSGDTIRLQGDWINNNTYTGSNSLVDMYGGNQQITGTAVTTFDNLNLGGGATVKRQTIDAITAGTLQLNDAELATDVNEMLVTNPNTGAITRNNGFVSSLGAGRLSRNTNTAATYLYPTGSPSYNNGPSIFRPIEFSPASTASNVYSAALIKGDATNDGYNVKTYEEVFCGVNPTFYHRLYHGNGADAADLTMYFDPGADGNWTEQAHWKNSRWSYIGAPAAGNGMGFSSVKVSGVNDFTPEPFALATKGFTVDAGPDVYINEGESTNFSPVIGANGTPTIEWSPNVELSCSDCATPTASPGKTTFYYIKVTDGGGCSVTDSLLVQIKESVLLVPNAFSPNNDGENDYFRVLNKNLDKVLLQIFNRWGEMVYESRDITQAWDPAAGWDGTYKNMKQDIGVFTWQCTYTLQGETRSKSGKGNVTLVR